MTDETFECRDPNGVPFAETNNYVDRRWAMKTIAEKDARIAELEAAYMELRMALKNWDSLIRHQYTGSSEAMSDMHACAQETVKLLYGPGPWPNVPPALR